jgi:hypothetical protein
MRDCLTTTTPFLRIETRMQTATIKRIDVDRAERFLVTASEAPRLTLKRWGYEQFPMKQIEGIFSYLMGTKMSLA